MCSDLLKPGGYARQVTYLEALTAAMSAIGAFDIDAFILATAGLAGGDGDRDAAILQNTEAYVEGLERDPHFTLAGNAKEPKKVGTNLELFDCLTCDKCIPVCPNDANFTMTIAPREIAVHRLRRNGASWELVPAEPLVLKKKHQIASFADFCNECGNCDIFCPEDGGPYLEKPRFFGTEEQWQTWSEHDGFFLERRVGEHHVRGRFRGMEYGAVFTNGSARYSGPGFAIQFERADLAGTITGEAEGEVDMWWYHVMDVVRQSVYESGDVNWVSAP